MKQMIRYFPLMLSCLLWISVLQADIYRVCDLWTSRPLDSVRVILDNDTIKLVNDGLFKVKERLSVRLQRDGYFEVQVDLAKFPGRIIYMEPLSTTDPITVVREATSGQALALPSRISRLQLKADWQDGRSNLAMVMAYQSGVFIKSYGGAGQLQTIGLRGMGAEQTQVLLDGIPVNNLQLGSVDLGQFDLFSMDKAEVYRGGSAMFGGSGAIGGTINLHPARLENRFGYRLAASLASFGYKEFGLSLQIPVAGFKQNASYLRQSGVNDYNADLDGATIQLQNRDFSRQIIQYNAEYSANQHIRAGVLLHSIDNEAGAPKATLSANAEEANRARLKDNRTLLQLYAVFKGEKGQVTARGFVRNEWMKYRDPALVIGGSELDSRHFNHESGAIIRGRYLPVSRILINGGLEASWQEIQSSEAGMHTRKRMAAFVLADWQVYSSPDFLSAWHLNASLRAESYSDYNVLLLPGIGLSYHKGVFKAYASAGKNYRAPSFNDLYWQPGGNPHLLPEHSINWEAGIGYENLLADVIHIKAEAAYYTNKVTNLIKWLPVHQIWTPQNIGEVLSKGVELDITLRSADERHALQLKYTRGTSRKNKAEFAGDQTVGNQLPYLPDEQFTLILHSGLASFNAGIEGSYISFRYKTLQNDAWQILPSAAVWRMWFSYGTRVFNQSLTLLVRIENLFDTNYQIMPGYPMPPRHYGLRVELAIKK